MIKIYDKKYFGLRIVYNMWARRRYGRIEPTRHLPVGLNRLLPEGVRVQFAQITLHYIIQPLLFTSDVCVRLRLKCATQCQH